MTACGGSYSYNLLNTPVIYKCKASQIHMHKLCKIYAKVEIRLMKNVACWATDLRSVEQNNILAEIPAN